MDLSTFWALVAAAKAEQTPGRSDLPQTLQRMLETLSPTEILAFERIFLELRRDAYRWDLWGAAHIIEGGCSDDGFADFRAGLIALGRDVYEAALADPNSLVRQPTRGVDFSLEQMNYVAPKAYRAVTGEEMPIVSIVSRKEPLGEPFDEDTVGELYPGLAAKFGSGR